jgi:hypothetical protein
VSQVPATWYRQGLLLAPQDGRPGWKSHAQAPTVLPLSDRCWRIYFGGRDAANRSHVFFADFDPLDGFRRLRVQARPVLSPGAPGDFDADGVAPSAALWVGDRVWLYYSGISARRDVPYQMAIGLVVSEDGGQHFRRACPGPVLAAGARDPLFVSMPCVWRDAEGFRAVYSTATHWTTVDRVSECHYQLRGAESDDGIHWRPHPTPALALAPGEGGLGRQWVVASERGQRMWFCRRGLNDFRRPGPDAYRLQAAHSDDGRTWQREGRDISWSPAPESTDWDGWMQAYPCVTPMGDELIMVYNGNDFGRGGFGWARSGKEQVQVVPAPPQGASA